MGSPEQWKVMAGSIYLALSRLHRRWRGRKSAKSLPILVIGSLRAGGGGKTPVVEWFAERLVEVAILVHPTPDEQHILETRFPGRVFAANSFLVAWKQAKSAGFTGAIADGGYQDPRLDGGFRLLLWDELPPDTADRLLPCGPWRELASASRRADLLLVHRGVACRSEPASCRFYRWETQIPAVIGAGPVLLACGVGNPDRVRADLRTKGVKVAAEHVVSDHGAFDQKEIDRMKWRFHGLPWLGTAKDRPRWLQRAGWLHVMMRSWHPEEPEVLLEIVRRELGLRCVQA